MNNTDHHQQQAIPFFVPEDMTGKWHAKRNVTGEADCGSGTLLGSDSIYATKQELTDGKQHPLICGRCRHLHRIGTSSTGIVR